MQCVLPRDDSARKITIERDALLIGSCVAEGVPGEAEALGAAASALQAAVHSHAPYHHEIRIQHFDI